MTAHKLPDLLSSDLRVIFVGTAAGKRAAQLGHYYAGRGNRFWQTLHEVGLTPCLFAPADFRDLLALGIGLTDMSKLGAGMDREIKAHHFDRKQFRDNVRNHRPSAVAFTSKKAAGVWLGARSTKAIAYGRQPASLAGFPTTFVLPSPSGAARSYWTVAPWQDLADWLRAT